MEIASPKHGESGNPIRTSLTNFVIGQQYRTVMMEMCVFDFKNVTAQPVQLESVNCIGRTVVLLFGITWRDACAIYAH
jgi:hypothetical protein